jgi:type II secretory pathway pseudopilin PulG
MNIDFSSRHVRALSTTPWRGGRAARRRAFTLMETVIAILVVGMIAVTLITGMNLVVRTVQLAQEELQATQVLVERLDTIRLYSWDKINTAGYIPTTFQLAIYPGANGDVSVGTNSSPVFHGAVTIANSSFSESYAGDVRLVTVSLNWTNGGLSRTRSMSTYVARYGLQNFVY